MLCSLVLHSPVPAGGGHPRGCWLPAQNGLFIPPHPLLPEEGEGDKTGEGKTQENIVTAMGIR